MMYKMDKFFFFKYFTILVCIQSSKCFAQFYGGTVSWRVISNQVRLTYRTTWERNKGPCGSGCSITDVGNPTSRGKPFDTTNWKCFNGCPANTYGGDLNYVLTAIGDSPGWEQGEKAFSYPYNGVKQISFSLDNVNWSLTSNESTPLFVHMETVIDVRIRNDTNVSNASPMAGLPPYIGIPHGCFWKVKLPVMDPDEDMLKCRFALPRECGHACTNLPDAYIDKSSCTIVLNATTDWGYSKGDSYRVAIVIEDYPLYPIQLDTALRTPSQSISSIPLQFTIRIINNTSCQNETSFVPPTREDGFRSQVISLNQKFVSAFYIETPDVNNTEFLVSSPAGMKYEKLLDDNQRANVTRVYQTWQVDRSKIGDALICVWGKEPSGLMSDALCIDAMILDIDDCKGSPCKRGKCVDLFHRRICKCPHGYKPPNCDKNVTCADNPCLNNGSCLNTIPYTCRCPQDFTGNRCENEIDPCMSFPCLNGGKCRQIHGGFQCLCGNGFNGSRCQTNTTDPCDSGPCYSSSKCVSHQNGFSCLCPPGLTGKLCSNNINECNRTVCYNGGSCIDNFGSFSCACLSGWHGNFCTDDTDECSVAHICNHGNCMNTPGNYSCVCNLGWTGTKCDINIDDCASSPCSNGGTCYDRVGSYICQCPFQWRGVNCKVPSYINPCLKHPCQNGATCLETRNNYTCICTQGWKGLLCDIDLNECNLTGICNYGTCHNILGSYKCFCNTGWTGNNCNMNIDDCFSSPCLNGATCLDLVGKYACQCSVGWTGNNCNIPLRVNYCSKSPCKNGGTCINTGTDFSCICNGGWKGMDCSSDVNECNVTGICNHGTCHNTPGTYICVCNKGWTNTTCDIDIDECHSLPCLNGATCLNLIGDYSCQCVSGWTGKNCGTLSNMGPCSKFFPCKNGATCIDIGKSFKCVCANGWSGQDCGIDINECNKAGICPQRTCTNTFGSYKCICGTGLIGQTKSGDCQSGNPKTGFNINLNNNTSQLPWIILASILGGLLLLTTVIGCYICLCGTCTRSRSVKGHEDNDKWVNKINSETQSSKNNSQKNHLQNALKTSPDSYNTRFSLGSNWNNSRSRLPISNARGSLPVPISQLDIDLKNIYLASRNDPFMHKSGKV